MATLQTPISAWVPWVAFNIGGLAITRTMLSIIMTWLLCEAMLFVPWLLQSIPYTGQM